jgi:hypothetical protein
MATINEKLRLYEDTFNEAAYSSVNHIANALQHKSDILSPAITHLYGRLDKRFPLSFLTEGMGKIRSLDATDYSIPIIGRPKKTSTVGTALYTAGDKPGVGHSTFMIQYKDKWFAKSFVIISPKGYKARIQSEPVQVGSEWAYKCQLINPSATAFMPLTELAAGVTWGRLFAPVGMEASRGVESRSYNPSMMTNQVTLLRKSYRYRGNVENKIMVIELVTDKGRTKFWSDWESYIRTLEWREEIEQSLWENEYNKDENGVIHNIDEDSGEVIPLGSGVYEQIPNKDTYTFLTENKIKSTIRDVMFNTSDSQMMNIEVFTGTGGMEEVDNALKGAAGNSGFQLIDSDKFIKEGSGGLVYGNYFNTYIHQDGHRITFRKLPLLDSGVRADISGSHPISGLPLDSYKMIFLDMSTYDGEANIQYVAERGRESMEWAVSGATTPKGFPDSPLRASDIDAASVHMMKSCGIQIKRPTNCFLLENVLS